MIVPVLLPHPRPSPAAVKSRFGSSTIRRIAREAQDPHRVAHALYLVIDACRGAPVRLVTAPRDGGQAVLVLRRVAHLAVWAHPQPSLWEDVLEHGCRVRVVGEQTLGLSEAVWRLVGHAVLRRCSQPNRRQRRCALLLPKR